MVDNVLKVYTASSKGGAVLIISASVVIVLLLLFYQLMPELAPTQAWVLLLILAGVTLWVGCRKLSSPVVCLEADQQAMWYIHSVGRYQLAWSDIAAIGQASLDGVDARYIGIRLKHYDVFLSHLPLRLAVRLLIEQRHLLMIGLRHQCPTGQCPTDLLIETGDFSTAQQTFRGVQAMFAHRMKNLRQAWNYDLFIPIDFIDWQAPQICLYLNQKRLQHSSLSCSGHE